VWLVSENWQIKEAADAVGLNYDYAREIVKAYNQQGISSLANRRKQPGRRGRAPLLNPDQLLQLQQALKQPPTDGGIWSGPKVAPVDCPKHRCCLSVRDGGDGTTSSGASFPPSVPVLGTLKLTFKPKPSSFANLHSPN
jgi:hypothetical protein